MLFDNEKDVNTYIRDNGFFINKDDNALCVKTGLADFKKVDNITIGNNTIDAESRLLSFIEYNTYPFINFNAITIPVIDTTIFKLFDERNKRIQSNKAMQDEFKKSKSVVKKNFKLVYFDTVSSKCKSHYFMYNTKNDTLSEYDVHLLDESDMDKKTEFRNMLHFNNIMNDTLENEYSEQYNIEKKKFDELKINKVH